MSLLRVPIVLAPLLVVAGCAGGESDIPVAERSREQASPDALREARFAEGRAIYDRSCASCHDPGAGDAPAIGVRQDWDDRSRLWTAVLFEHAKSGFLNMPAKGGATELSDRDVGAAAEYILSATYPELPPID